MEHVREADADGAIIALCDELVPQGVHAVGRRLKMHSPSDDSWHLGKVTHFNRRSGKHRLLFENGSTDVIDLATERLVFLSAAEASDAEDDDGSEDEEIDRKGVKPARLRSKRARSQVMELAQKPPSQRCVVAR